MLYALELRPDEGLDAARTLAAVIHLEKERENTC